VLERRTLPRQSDFAARSKTMGNGLPGTLQTDREHTFAWLQGKDDSTLALLIVPDHLT